MNGTIQHDTFLARGQGFAGNSMEFTKPGWDCNMEAGGSNSREAVFHTAVVMKDPARNRKAG